MPSQNYRQYKLLYTVVTFAILLTAGLNLSAQGVILTDNPLEGQRIFESKGCIKCHSIFDFGGDMGPDLGKDPNIKGIFEITSAMWNHSPQMTEEIRRSFFSRPTFTLPEIEQLYTYLYYLRYLQTEGNAERGKRVFRQKNCSKCHQMTNPSSGSGSDLRSLEFFVSPLYLIQIIWNHGQQMTEMMSDMQISRPELSELDLQDIASYLREISKTPQNRLTYTTPGNPLGGEKVFIDNKCSLCHNITDRATSVGPDLREADYAQNVSHIGAVLWNHLPQMWEMMRENSIDIPELTDTEIADLVSYIYFLKFFSETGNALTGENIFKEKGCSTCHDTDNAGSGSGRSVVDMPVLSTTLEFSRLIWNHASQMEDYMSDFNMPWPEFTSSEMTDLYSYLVKVTKKE